MFKILPLSFTQFSDGQLLALFQNFLFSQEWYCPQQSTHVEDKNRTWLWFSSLPRPLPSLTIVLSACMKPSPSDLIFLVEHKPDKYQEKTRGWLGSVPGRGGELHPGVQKRRREGQEGHHWRKHHSLQRWQWEMRKVFRPRAWKGGFVSSEHSQSLVASWRDVRRNGVLREAKWGVRTGRGGSAPCSGLQHCLCTLGGTGWVSY